MKTIVIALAGSFWAAFQIHAASADGWTTVSPREEIRPQFQHAETGGKSGTVRSPSAPMNAKDCMAGGRKRSP
jgi:hypothetical protein